jgi:hypothetical protein
MALEPDFVADSPYGPGGLLLDDILVVDRERGLVVARMPTSTDVPRCGCEPGIRTDRAACGGLHPGTTCPGGPVWAQDAPASRLLGCFL